MDTTVKTITHPRLKRWNVEIKRRDENDSIPILRGTFYVIVCDTRDLWNDNPVRTTGRIMYDFPERVPAYAKELTAAAFAWIDGQFSNSFTSENKETMYYHIIENTMRNGIKGYRLVQTLVSWQETANTVIAQGTPTWIIAGSIGHINPATSFLGGYPATRWNSGSGFVVDTMPSMPYLGEK